MDRPHDHPAPTAPASPRGDANTGSGDAVPPDPGTLPDEREPDPAPERDELRLPGDGDERTELGEPVGRDTIREGRVNGVQGAPLGQHGQGQGG